MLNNSYLCGSACGRYLGTVGKASTDRCAQQPLAARTEGTTPQPCVMMGAHTVLSQEKIVVWTLRSPRMGIYGARSVCIYLCTESQMLNELGGLEPAHGRNLQAQLLPAIRRRVDNDRPAKLRGTHVPELAGLHAFACLRRCAERLQSSLQGLEVYIVTFWMICITHDALAIIRYCDLEVRVVITSKTSKSPALALPLRREADSHPREAKMFRTEE